MALPNFLIIGAARAGTTALHVWLAEHPQVCMSRPKETQYFTLDHSRGAAFYESYFAHHRDEPAVGESTPMYLSLPSVPGRIATELPNARLIAILRDPADQAFSAWWMMRALGVEGRSFEEAITSELEHPRSADEVERSWGTLLDHSNAGERHDGAAYLLIGRYAEAIERYRRHFANDQLSVFLHDDLVRDPVAFTRSICEALDIDHSSAPTSAPAGRNQASGVCESWVRRRLGTELAPTILGRVARRAAREVDRRRPRPRMHPDTRARLDAHFAAANDGLDDLLGRDVSHWYRR